jgi:VanZ family protein
MVNREFRWLPPIIWGLLIAILSLIPGGPGNLHLFGIQHIDKIGHFGMYGIWGFLVFHAFIAGSGLSTKKSMLFSFVILTLIGITLEFGQDLLTDYRSYEVADMMANGLGSLVGSLVGWFFRPLPPKVGNRK